MALEVKDDNGKNVDWWFIYKLPSDTTAPSSYQGKVKETTGKEYLYADVNTKTALSLSPHQIHQKEGALQNTLNQIYQATSQSKDSLGWICYNDEIPDQDHNDDRKGHTKGVLAFDLASDTAFWLLHSWPKFPDIKTGAPAAWDNAQTYLCIALKDVATARKIAEVMYHNQEPQTYQTRLPDSLEKSDFLYQVATNIDVNEKDPPADIEFHSKGGQRFRLMAKNRHWDKDFWIDLVGPHLKTNFEVETWRRRAIPDKEDSDRQHHVTDILYLNLEGLDLPYEWKYTKDHSKWGIGQKDHWVCVADINRQVSQEHRGGGGICFQNEVLWQSLSKIQKLKK